MADLPDGFIAHDGDLSKIVGSLVYYVNNDSTPVVRLQAWLDGIDEGWAVVEFGDNSRATVRPSRIVAYRPTTPQEAGK